jgi:hypothetical protein
LSHAVYPSVAQKDENLTTPNQDCRGMGMSPGFLLGHTRQ